LLSSWYRVNHHANNPFHGIDSDPIETFSFRGLI